MVKYSKIVFIFFLLIVLSCKQNGFQKKTSKSETLFSLVDNEKTHIDFVNKVKQDDNFNCIKYTYALIGAGVAVGDVNNDGLVDIYLTSNQKANKLYVNKGDFDFEDVTSIAQVEDAEGWTTGTSMIDINNDGWLDIYVCKSASINHKSLRRNKLYVNQKDGTFKEEAKLWGLDHSGYSIQSYFFDYDKDGDLDMYLVNHRSDFENTLQIEKKEKQKFFGDTSDHLFRNDGNHFTNVTVEAKIINKTWGLSASIGDFNNDGWPDIYVANDYIAPDILYINNRNGTFSNQINTRFKHISYNSMGSDFADINNDFLPDLVVLEMSAEDHIRSKENMPTMNTEGFNKIVNSNYHRPYMANVLQINNGNGSFSDIGQLAGISKTDWSWAPLVADFDNDGYKDMFVSNGIERNFSNQDYAKKIKSNLDNNITMTIQEVIEMIPSEKLANYSYKNNGDLTFTNTSEDWGFTKKLNSNGVAYADFDNDGDLDLVMNNMSDIASIYENNATGNFLNIKLVGNDTNINGIGAKISVYSKEKKQYQEMYPTRGYLSSVTNVLNFGFGKEEIIDKIEVEWNNGTTSILNNIAANTTVTVNIKEAKISTPIAREVNRNFISVNPKQLGINYSHTENSFNDFSRQVLLPQKLSQQGPALNVADVNGDGLDDFFVGGALGQSAEMYIQNKTGGFQKSNEGLFNQDKNFEDLKAHFFDADNDGDMDLYVTSGGYELVENSPLLQDRLYINNGKGIFKRGKNVPQIQSNSKSVISIDFDNDGDLDLVIGGHVVPGKYPLATKSYFLENRNGMFKDVTSTVAPEFSDVGIINDLVFSDYDNDGDKDLIIAGEWMPITFFDNTNGIFSKKELEGLKNTSGWWNTIKEVDVNNDGHKDYLVGNLGENNKFKPTPEKPLHIYGNNFDENGTYDMVLSKIYNGMQVPVRGKECSTEQNAFVSERMPTFKEFATSSLLDIYGEQALESSYHKEAYTFSSVIIINNGDGTFKINRLPSTAQFGPTMSFETADVNDDGIIDIIGAGNIFESEVETIRYDSNNGYILLGTKEGDLEPYKDLNFYNGYNVKAIKKISIGGSPHLLIGNNNAALELYKI